MDIHALLEDEQEQLYHRASTTLLLCQLARTIHPSSQCNAMQLRNWRWSGPLLYQERALSGPIPQPWCRWPHSPPNQALQILCISAGEYLLSLTELCYHASSYQAMCLAELGTQMPPSGPLALLLNEVRVATDYILCPTAQHSSSPPFIWISQCLLRVCVKHHP